MTTLMTTLLIFLSIFVYLIIGRVLMVLMDKHNFIHLDNQDYDYGNPDIFLGSIFFPIVILYSLLKICGDKIIKKINEDFK